MTATWYREGPLVEVVHDAISSNVAQSEIVDELAEHRFSDTTRRRVEAIVAGAVERSTPDPGQAPLSQPIQSNDPPRPVPTRFIDYGDIEHLGDRELSRLLGLTFERFGGNTAFPLLDAVDVLWHRQHTTVGIQVVATQDSERTLDAIEEVATGETNPPDARAPSRLVVVTAASIDDELTAAASDADVELCGRRQVARWLRIVQLPPTAYGPLLEEGEQSSFDAESVLEELPPLPARVEGCDPLDIASSADVVGIEPWAVATASHDKSVQPDTGSTTPSWEPSTDDDSTPEVTSPQSSDTPDFEVQPTEGKYGRLYADPAEDGDFDGIDEWVDGLDEEES